MFFYYIIYCVDILCVTVLKYISIFAVIKRKYKASQEISRVFLLADYS